jgi:hypothetical protein
MVTKRDKRLLETDITKQTSINQLEARCDHAEEAYHAVVKDLPEWHLYQEAIRRQDPEVREYARQFHCAVAHLPEWWAYEEMIIRLHGAMYREGTLEGMENNESIF